MLLAYGQSDEYSFVLHPSCRLFDRRESKIVSTVGSVFTAWYIALWGEVMGMKMDLVPSFDARAVCFPSVRNLRDYLCWRQVDCEFWGFSTFFFLSSSFDGDLFDAEWCADWGRSC